MLLLLADVDNTLTGDPPALESFNRFWETVHVPLGSWLCYNTARPCGPGNTESGYVELVAKKKNPLVVPDVLIAGEGTEIFWFRQPESGRFDWVPTRDREWARRLDAIWDIGRVRAALEPHDERVWLEENRRPNCWEGIDDINCDDPFRCAIAVSKQSAADAIAAQAALLAKCAIFIYVFLFSFLCFFISFYIAEEGGQCARCDCCAGRAVGRVCCVFIYFLCLFFLYCGRRRVVCTMRLRLHTN